MKLSLYIHIPFCKQKCSYCDFFSVPLNDSAAVEPVLDKIISEIKSKLDNIPEASIKSIFIGGGTPSIIPPGIFSRFLSEVSKITEGMISSDYEFSTEANIESCSPDFLDAAESGGINRLSLGVQSFESSTLDMIGRAVYPDNIFDAVSNISGKWKHSLSLDIISGVTHRYPEDIYKALKLSPSHLSVYQLTVEENTPLHDAVSTGSSRPPDEKLQAEAVTEVNRILSQAGYSRYEISNYSKTGSECRHNLGYWNMQSYIGAGPSAVSSIYYPEQKTRITNPADVGSWHKGDFAVENLSDFDFLLEHFIMGCRLISGIDKKIFTDRFGSAPAELIPETAASWAGRNLLDLNKCALSESGLLYLDSFLADVYDELEKNFKK